jgi:hypothetical protein
MDLSTITNPIVLKSMAYDEIAKKEQAESNLKVINQRILQVSQGEKAIKEATDAAAATPPDGDAAPADGDAAPADGEQPADS